MAVAYEPDMLEDTIGRMSSTMNTTITTSGVSISQSRGLIVDGDRFGEAAGREVVGRGDLDFEEGILGQGASSVVRKASHVREPGRSFAVKIFRIFDEQRRHQLVKEVRVLFDLDCAALVQFHGAYFEADRVGIILEFMDYGSLEDAIEVTRPRGLPEPALAAVAYQVLWGLAYLHFERRLHRDIKPANVLINSRGDVKLSDFGISRVLKESSDQAASTMVGTFKYMSPERLHSDVYSFSADVWSVGIMLLDAAAGAPVFASGATPVEIVQLVRDLDFAYDALRKARLSRFFDDFAIACLRIDPAERPRCDALLEDPWLLDYPELWGQSEPSLESAAAYLEPWLAARRPPRHGARRDAHHHATSLSASSSPALGECHPASSQVPSGRDFLNQTYQSDLADDLAQTIQDDFD